MGFLKDASHCQLLWDFIACPSRVFRISVPIHTEDMRNPSDWIHFKIYRQQGDQLVLH